MKTQKIRTSIELEPVEYWRVVLGDCVFGYVASFDGTTYEAFSVDHEGPLLFPGETGTTITKIEAINRLIRIVVEDGEGHVRPPAEAKSTQPQPLRIAEDRRS